MIGRLGRFRDELVGFLLVARAELLEDIDRTGIAVEVTKTGLVRCERCWTHRPDVGANGLCQKCVAALAATGKVPATGS